jgi:hypothetical protein
LAADCPTLVPVIVALQQGHGFGSKRYQRRETASTLDEKQADDSLATSIAAGSMERMPLVQLPHQTERIGHRDVLFDGKHDTDQQCAMRFDEVT